MHREINIEFLGFRNDCIEEILNVLKILFRGNILIELDVFSHLTESLRLPSGKAEVIRAADHGRGDSFKGELGSFIMAVSHSGTAVRKLFCKIAPVPVHNRHEIITDALNSGRCKILHRGNVIVDEQISGRQALLYVFMDIETLDHFHLKAVRIDLVLDQIDLIHSPDIADGNSGKMSSDSANAGNLLNVLQRYTVIAVWKPP